MTDFESPKTLKSYFKTLKPFYEENDKVRVEMRDIYDKDVAVQLRQATRDIFSHEDADAFYEALD